MTTAARIAVPALLFIGISSAVIYEKTQNQPLIWISSVCALSLSVLYRVCKY